MGLRRLRGPLRAPGGGGAEPAGLDLARYDICYCALSLAVVVVVVFVSCISTIVMTYWTTSHRQSYTSNLIYQQTSMGLPLSAD